MTRTDSPTTAQIQPLGHFFLVTGSVKQKATTTGHVTHCLLVRRQEVCVVWPWEITAFAKRLCVPTNNLPAFFPKEKQVLQPNRFPAILLANTRKMEEMLIPQNAYGSCDLALVPIHVISFFQTSV